MVPSTDFSNVGARATRPRVAPEIVVVGAAPTAAQAAAMFLVGLPDHFELPLVLIVGAEADDHRDDHRDLCVALQAHCALPVRQIDDKDPILAGRIHLAPADYHVLVERRAFILSTDGPVNGARPSIDVLLESVAEVFGEGAVCVLLGLSARDGVDGCAGAARVRASGGLVIVQDPRTATSDGATDVASFPAATVLHLSEIAPFVTRLGEAELT
ncbi:MAG TPA: chemotaxis protein CheB [Polyangia bacterium]|nr:chemotaxis protein CheB [Polyangia bacterium]